MSSMSPARKLNLLIGDAEMARPPRRVGGARAKVRAAATGKLYLRHVSQADRTGCDFDFLEPVDAAEGGEPEIH
ncbi:hypothetical protein ACU4HD_01625 [Cupriavidus basilensis]